MDEKSFNVSLSKNPIIEIKVIKGHFTTSNAHSSHFLDVGGLKTNNLAARNAARELALPYLANTLVDTIVCMEKTEVIGAYLAEELTQNGTNVVNSGSEIHVVTPVGNINGNLVFPDSMIQWINGKGVLLIVASVSSGRTLDSALECLTYYGGKVVGISALFKASDERHNDLGIHALFTSEDIPDYTLSSTSECEMCKAGVKLDAIISSEGYTKIKDPEE